jgi:hypothetical protein
MQHSISTSLAAIALAILTACSGDSTGLGNNANAQLGFAATSSASASAALVPLTVDEHTLDLTGVALTVSRAELKRGSDDACDDDDSNRGPGNCRELKVGPTTIDLPLTGSVVAVPANTIPAGTYRELELRVSQIEVKGTFDGKAFDITLHVNAKSEIEFDTPLVVSDTGATSITVAVPTTNWFVNTDGSLIDPNALASSPSLNVFVQNRVRASFRAFEDRDHDGHDDHGGDRGGNRGRG